MLSPPLAASATAAITRQEAARFLQQAAFGGSSAAINAVISRGYEGWIDWQVSLPRHATSRFALLNPVKDSLGRPERKYTGVDDVLWRRLMSGNDVLRQRVTLALSEIFVVSMDDVGYPWCGGAVANYVDRLEACALGTPGQPVVANGPGTYRHLLERIILSHAMGHYLSMYGSMRAGFMRGRQPDENFARELLQLFSVGLHLLRTNGLPRLDANGQKIDSYTDADVSALARIFTGWDSNGDPFNDPPAFIQTDMFCHDAGPTDRHDMGAKTVWGRSFPAGVKGLPELRAALDLIAAHGNVGPFISRQLIQRPVTSHPSPGYVARVNQVFSNNGAGVRGDLRAVVKAILLDGEARTVSTSPTAGRLIPPMNRLVQWVRTCGVTSASGTWPLGDRSDPARGLGQSPMRAPSVFNFYRPGYVHPGTPGTVTAGLGQQGLTLPEFQIANELSVVGYVNTMRPLVQGQHADVRPDYTPWLSMAGDPGRLFDEFNLLLAAGRLGNTARDAVIKAFERRPATTDEQRRLRVGAVVWLILCAPDYLIQR